MTRPDPRDLPPGGLLILHGEDNKETLQQWQDVLHDEHGSDAPLVIGIPEGMTLDTLTRGEATRILLELHSQDAEKRARVDCKQCGDTHNDLALHRFTRPLQAGPVEWGWGLCPETAEPVLHPLTHPVPMSVGVAELDHVLDDTEDEEEEEEDEEEEEEGLRA